MSTEIKFVATSDDYLDTSYERASRAHATKEEYERIELRAVDAEGRNLGGLQAFRSYSRLVIDLLSVEPDQQSKGIGAELLTKAENWGRDNCCFQAHLNTQYAEAFYKREGYTTVFADKRGVEGGGYFLMVKELTDD